MPPDQLDKSFRQRGWHLDPATCLDCIIVKKDSRKMVTGPTPAAISAQAKMFTLLHAHFNPDTGSYGGDYSDAKVAAEADLSVDLVRGVREEALGPLKEPPELAALTADIAALSSLLDEAVAPIKSELDRLRERVAEVRRKFAA